MQILITGANGFLGHYLVKQLLEKGYTVIATGKGECRLPFASEQFIYAPMDFTDPFAVHDVFEKYKPEIVVHAGAMGKPDECETNQWQAFLINVEGTLTMLSNAAEQGSFFVFISTDFVFDGERGMYKEDDELQPINYYGQTKLEAEEAVKEYEHAWAIARTVLLYGKPATGRTNILTIVKDNLEKGQEIRIVDDQVRTPTFIEDFADGVIRIIDKRATGVYHLSGKDVMTPYQMACRTAHYLDLNQTLIKRVTAADFAEPAKRPPKTGFVIDKARAELKYEPVSFEEGLAKTFKT